MTTTTSVLPTRAPAAGGSAGTGAGRSGASGFDAVLAGVTAAAPQDRGADR
ncbi:hypothetical protein HGA09_19425, partial [Cellulomonas hominis]|nr:hypothetical protein [Cellulomonas hominis]